MYSQSHLFARVDHIHFDRVVICGQIMLWLYSVNINEKQTLGSTILSSHPAARQINIDFIIHQTFFWRIFTDLSSVNIHVNVSAAIHHGHHKSARRVYYTRVCHHVLLCLFDSSYSVFIKCLSVFTSFSSAADARYPPQPPGQQQQWMQAPMVPQGCPPGLEYLTQIDQVLAHQVAWRFCNLW